MNNGGLGVAYSLSLEDKNFSKGMASANKATGLFGSTIDTAVMAGAGLAGMSKRMFNMPGIMQAAGQIQNIAEDFKITTTNTEAWGVMASKASSQVLTGLNLTDKEFSRAKGTISSVAFAMNTDVGSVAQSFKALQQAGVDVKKIGFKDFGEFQKFMSVTGTDSKKFAHSIGLLRNQFHFTDKQIEDTLTTVIAIGKRFDMGAEASSLMADAIGMVAEEGATMFQTMGPDKTKKFLEGTQLLATAFMKAGHSAEEAKNLALGVGQGLMKGQENINRVFSGMDEDLSGIMTDLSENFGGIHDAYAMVQQDPMKFAKVIAESERRIKKTTPGAEQALMRFNEQLKGNFGPQFAALVSNSMDTTADKIAEVQKELAKPGGLADKHGVIGKMAANYQDGRTMTERLMWATDQFRTSLKHLHGVESDAAFLKRSKESFAFMTKQLQGLVNKGGLLGKATSMLVEFSNHGLGGVASKIFGSYGPAMAVLIQQFGPVIQQFGALIPLVGALASPFTLLVGAVAGVYYYFKGISEGGNSFTKMVDSALPKLKKFGMGLVDSIEENAPKIAGKILDVIKMIDWSRIGRDIADAIVWGIKNVVPAAAGIVKDVAVGYAKGFMQAGADIYTKINSDIEETDSEMMKHWKYQAMMANDLWSSVFGSEEEDRIQDFYAKIYHLDKNNFDDHMKMMQMGNEEMAKRIANTFDHVLQNDALSVQDMMLRASKGIEPVVTKTWGEMWASFERSAGMTLDATAKQAVTSISNAVSTAADSAKKMFGGVMGDAKKAQSSAALQGAAKDMGISTGEAAELIKAVSGMSPSQIQQNVSAIKGTYISFLKDVTKESKIQLDDSRKYFDKFMSQQKDFWAQEATGIVGQFANAAQTVLTNFWNNVIKQAEDRSRELIATLNRVLFSVGTAGAGSPVGPDGKPMVTATPAASGGGSGVAPSFDTLIAHIDNPAWSRELLDQMRKQHDDDMKMMRTLIEVTALSGKISGKTIRRQDLDQEGQNLGIPVGT